MVYRVELAARAVGDLTSIYHHIRAGGSARARAWFDRLELTILGLSDNPARCPIAPDDPALRHLLFGSGRNIYRILFEIDEPSQAVFVLHIRHGARAPLKPGQLEPS